MRNLEYFLISLLKVVTLVFYIVFLGQGWIHVNFTKFSGVHRGLFRDELDRNLEFFQKCLNYLQHKPLQQ